MSYLIDHWHERPHTLTKQAGIGNLAKEFTGIADAQRGIANLGKGNLLKGFGQLGLGALYAGSTLIPGVGWAARGTMMAGKGALMGAKALKRQPLQVKVWRQCREDLNLPEQQLKN
mgnify:CR=1 FL=1